MSTEMRPEQGIAGKFVRSALDENGVLSKIEFTNSENFNFAYDVMDALAERKPDQTALIYVSKDRTIEKKFTFQDIKDYSNRAANYFKSLGIRKGDKVMLVLKRHYQYWFTMMALHKIGAIAIPATNILKATDYQYRIEAAGVSAVVCTSDDGITASIDTFADDKLTKIVVNHPVEGWNFFDEGIMECSTEFPRPTGEDAVGGKDDILFVMFTSGTTELQRWLHTIICIHLDITSQQNTGTATNLVRFISQFQIQAGVRLSGASSTDSGCARHAYSYLTLIHSVRTLYSSL